MKKVIGLFSPLVNYYIILEIRIKTPTLIKFVSLEFLEIYFIYGKFKYRKKNLLLQFHFRDKNL